jgi:hypothetical protein
MGSNKTISEQNFTGERACFQACDIEFKNCSFLNGESPLKHSQNIILFGSKFSWKYPLWYAKNISLNDCKFEINARAGVWYSSDIVFKNCEILAPKIIRRCNNVTLNNIDLLNATETLWECKNITLQNVSVSGDYFGMNSKYITADNLKINGNYCFDGAENLTLTNSILNSKDAFWNSKNVIVKNSQINGEYIGWNSINLTLINCTIDSLQGFCYCKNLNLIDCELKDTNLAFEYSSVKAKIRGKIKSIKNPKSGKIVCKKIDEIILENDKIDPKLTKILEREDDEI